MLNIGKLYSCSECFLVLYPDKETAVAIITRLQGTQQARGSRIGGVEDTEAGRRRRNFFVNWWKKELGKHFRFCDPRTPFLVLSAEDDIVEILLGDKRHWIINEDWIEFEEIR